MVITVTAGNMGHGSTAEPVSVSCTVVPWCLGISPSWSEEDRATDGQDGGQAVLQAQDERCQDLRPRAMGDVPRWPWLAVVNKLETLLILRGETLL